MEEINNESEAKRQADGFQWFWNTYPDLRGLLYHVPNGEYRDKVTAAKLKGLGVVAGIPDMVLNFRAKTWFFEWKDDKGRVSDAQAKIHSLMRSQGFIVFVVRDVEHFKKLVVDILEAKQTDPYRVGLTKEQYYYRHRIFDYIYTTLGHNEIVLLNNLVEPVNKLLFTEYVKEFISMRYDEKAGFELLFTSDYEAIYKRENGKPIEPIFYNGKSIVE